LSAAPIPPLPPDRSRWPLDLEPSQPPRRHDWRLALRWAGVGILVLIVLVVVGVIVLLKSNRAHQYILRTAEQKVTASLGTEAKLGNFVLHFSGISPTLDLYDVIVYGAAPYRSPPLLQVDHIAVGVRVVSLLHRRWYFNSLTVDHPVAWIFVDRQGMDNLPKTTSRGGQSHTIVFDLGVRHALLDRGEIYYNNRKDVLNADLHNLLLQSAFNTADRSYAGAMSYSDGRVRMGTFKPIPHDLRASFIASPTQFILQRAVLSSGRSQFVLTATLSDYAQPRLQANYSALLDAGQFARILKNPSLPLGDIRLAGEMQYRSRTNQPMLGGATVEGKLSSALLRVRRGSLRGNLRDLRADYRLSSGNLYVTNVGGQVLGGQLTGNATMVHITGATRARVQAGLRRVSLGAISSISNSPAVKDLELAGNANLNLNAGWGKTLNNLVASVAANAQGSLRPAGAGGRFPLSGRIQARYTAANKRLALASSYIRTPETSVSLDGTLSTRSALNLRFVSKNLHEVETFLPASTTKGLSLYGQGAFAGTVRGSTARPQLQGVLTASNLRVNGGDWKSLRTYVSASPSQASLQNGLLQASGRGRVAFNLRLGLRQWRFDPTNPLQVGLNGSQLDLENLERTAGKQLPAFGTLSFNISMDGSTLNPTGRGVVKLTKAQVEGQSLQSAALQFQGNGTQVQGNLGLQLPKVGRVQATFTVNPRQETYSTELRASGIQLAQLQEVKARNVAISGVVNLTASGQGSFHNPQLTVTLQVPQLAVRNQAINSLLLQANVANHVAVVALNSQVVGTTVSAYARMDLTGAYYTTAAIDTSRVALQPILALYAPSQAADISGETEVHATLQGPLKNRFALNAHATIPILQVNYKNAIRLGAANPIHLDFENGVLAMQRATIRGTDTNLEMQATIPTNSAAPASMLLLGNINLRIAELFSPDITSSGEMRLNINSYGARSNPNIQGQVQIINASLASSSAPIGLQNGNGTLTLTRDRLDITHFQGTVGGGTVAASGGLIYRPTLRFDLAMAAKGMRLLYPQGVREGLDLNLTLTGTRQAALLAGSVQVNELSFTPDFDLTNFLGQFTGTEAAPAPAGGFAQNLRLDVAAQSTSGMNLVSRTLSLQAAANLQLRGTAADPVILGRVNLNGGDLIFMGNRYVLEGGTIQFANPNRTEPVLNVSASTTIQQYQIYLRFEGPVEQMHTNYSSVPALPPADIIHLLAFGTTTEAAAANPTPGTLGAESVVASQVTSQVTSRVAKVAGISQLSVDPELGGVANSGAANTGARITIQQRVTGNLFVTFSTDVTTTQDQVIQLQYKVSPRLSFSGTHDQNGGFAFDTRIRKTW
jgi:translocation and assembly module TamB